MMSAFTIKLIAMLSMLTDHAGYILMLTGRTRGDMYMLLRSIGRPAFVLFAFLIVNGCEKTSDMKRYLSRLVIFALVSQPAYSLAFTPENYRAPLFSAAPTAELMSVSPAAAALVAFVVLVYLWCVCAWRVDASLLWLCAALILPYVQLEAFGLVILGDGLNVFYTLGVSLALIGALKGLSTDGAYKDVRRWAVLLAAVAVAALVHARADYGLFGVALILGLYLTRRSRAAQAAVILLWCFAEYYVRMHYVQLMLFAMLAVLPVLFYSGRRGPRARGFYWIYPLHLYAFSLAGILLLR